MFRRAGPAGFRDVDDDTVRGAVFDLGVDMGRQVAAQTQGLVDVVADRRTGVGEFLIDGFDAIDLEADMVQAAVFFALRNARRSGRF